MSFFRFAKLAALAAVLLLGLLGAHNADAQVPIPLQEQIRAFESLSGAQQQALIRELQSQLPPAQREAVLGMLTGGQTGSSGNTPALGDAGTLDIGALNGEFGAALQPAEPRFAAGDTLVLELEAGADAALAPEEEERRERLLDGNPYVLDELGMLYLPGVPPIGLAGLDVAQAMTRLRTQRELRLFDLVLTRLPLEAVGANALEPFGYELFAGVPSTFAPATNIPVPVDYVVGPGDTVNVQLFGNLNAEYFLTVSREGVINFPELGPLNVSGLSFPDVRALINERVAEQMIGVRASTTLGELRSIRVFVLGDVARPGSYTVSGLATMTNALFASGGVETIGSLRKIELKRNDETVTTLDLYDLLLRGDTSGDARMQPGDVIFVPPVGPTVAVHGEVRRPAIYELTDERSVTDIIDMAGGLRANANRSAVKLERIVPGRGLSATDVDLTALAAVADIRDGDVLRVDPNLNQIEGSVRLAGNVQRPGIYQWREGMRIGDLLPSPELVKPSSDLNYVLIRREVDPNVEIEVLSVDLEAVWQRRAGAANLDLQPRDTVYVFHRETGRQQYLAPIIEELVAQSATTAPRPVVRVGGQVRAPGDYPLEPGMRINDLLRASGGLRDDAYTIEAELTRYSVVDGEYRETGLVEIDLAAVLAGDAAANLSISPYDYLGIRRISHWSEQETVMLEGEIVFPGAYPIRQGETLSSVLERAGGLTEFAYPEGSVFNREELRQREREQIDALIRRLESDLASRSLAADSTEAVSTGQFLLTQLREAEATGRLVIRLDDVVAGRLDYDIVLQGGDRLFVPEYRQEVTVLGEVQYPTSHTYLPELDRDDYVGRSGGLTRRADSKRVYVVRANGEVLADRGGRWFRRDDGIEIRPGDTVVAPIDIDRQRPLTLWTNITQIMYNLAIAAAAVNSF